MDSESAKQGITLSEILLPIATLVIGLVVPKMEWLSDTVRTWLFAGAIGLAIFAILISNIVKGWLNAWISSNTVFIIGIILSLVVIVILGIEVGCQ